MDTQSILVLFGFIGACTAAAASASVYRPDEWYRALAKPSWNPPDFLFPIAWTILYGMIAYAGFLVWKAAGFAGALVPLAIYGVQLVLNGLWSVIFFGWKRLDLALIELIALWVMILATIIAFYPINQTAAFLLLPYLAWVTFAGLLNYRVLKLNPDAVPQPQG